MYAQCHCGKNGTRSLVSILNIGHDCFVQGEIDAREDSFRTVAESGQLLMESEHYAVDEVKEKLVTLANEKTTLLDLWEERRVLYEQCMDLQIFYRDTEQADAWMSKQVRQIFA